VSTYIICAVGAAVNAAFYADSGSPICLGVAILAGLMALPALVRMARP
jgi:hypothetical protein